jgi:hypothetical protein
MVTTTNGWDYVAAPQRDPRAACMLLAAALWEQDPGIRLAALESQVENAVSELENGARRITIGDDIHRVGRTDIVIDIPPVTRPIFGRRVALRDNSRVWEAFAPASLEAAGARDRGQVPRR